ncbi:MAG TPA: glycosyltransferase, partial [Bacteroidales bacterium]|nr:glycosyltransferase [Bacteroidales bacterium]
LPEPDSEMKKEFIYVGWLDKRKGFPEFFRLVEKAPGNKYRVVGPPRDETGHHYFNRLKDFPNVRLMGALSHNQTLKEIACAKALISTSPSEGFPNVFIEAWAYGIPVISLNIDPGNVIEKEGLGVFAHGSMETMLQALNDHPGGVDFAKKAKSYVESNHALTSLKISEINRIFTELRYGKDRIS